MEEFIVGHELRALVTVAPIIAGRPPEGPRQQCLAALADRLRDHGVTDLVMDSREDQRIPPRRRRSRPNENDRATIDGLTAPTPDRPVRIRFADDRFRPALTLADAVAWRARHALTNRSLADGISEFSRLAPVTVLLDAALVNELRARGTPRTPLAPHAYLPRTVFQTHLSAFRETSREAAPVRSKDISERAAGLRQRAIRDVWEGGPDLPAFLTGRRQPAPCQAGRIRVGRARP